MYIVVCYDISSNRQRLRLHRLLLGYGTPVQRSVFECQLTRRQFHQLQLQVRGLARGNRDSDSVRYYTLCAPCQMRTQATGTILLEENTSGDFLV